MPGAAFRGYAFHRRHRDIEGTRNLLILEFSIGMAGICRQQNLGSLTFARHGFACSYDVFQFNTLLRV